MQNLVVGTDELDVEILQLVKNIDIVNNNYLIAILYLFFVNYYKN